MKSLQRLFLRVATRVAGRSTKFTAIRAYAALALALCPAWSFAQSAPAWQSGQPIPLGTTDGRGTFSAGLTNFPVGWATITGAPQPDLFVIASRHSFPAGLYLYPWKATGSHGEPVYGERKQVKYPFEGNTTFFGSVVEAHGAVWGFFLDSQSSELIATKLDREALHFREDHRISLAGLPRFPSVVTAVSRPDGKWSFVFSVSDGTSRAPEGAGNRDAGYVPYDGRGIWRGGTARFHLWVMEPGSKPRQISKNEEASIWGPGTVSVGRLTKNGKTAVVSGSWFGNISYYEVKADGAMQLAPRRYAVGEDGVLLRNPVIGTNLTVYPKPDGSGMDLITTGEGPLFFYRFTGRFDAKGNPVYQQPKPVLQEKARLYAGTLAVPSIVDWDGDGVLDIVSGNSEGRILFFRNRGTNRQPAMEVGVALKAGGREIFVQPGYKGDIQGPGEARWGYISPNVQDWNGDGLPDILSSDSTARHYVYLNGGTKREPKLQADETIYLNGLDLHGTWRVRPGVGKLGDRMAYIALDDDDEFHLYWRIDNYNVADGGKLRMDDGGSIRSNFLGAGATGRSKIEVVDWDGDGRVDLLVGTPKHHSIPNPETGLPNALGLPGTMVLFLKNVGTNDAPRYAFPVGLKHKGENIYLGHHESGAAAGPLGPGNGMNIVMSREDGALFFFQREQMQ